MSVQSVPNLIGMRELLDSFMELLNKVKETAFTKVKILDNKNKGLKKEYDKFENNFTQEKIEFNKKVNKDYIKTGAKNILKSSAKVIGIATIFLMTLTSSEKAKFAEANSLSKNIFNTSYNYEQAGKQVGSLKDEIMEYLNEQGVDADFEKKSSVDSQNVQIDAIKTSNVYDDIRIDMRGNMDDTMESLGAVNEIINFYSHNKIIQDNNAEIDRWLKKIMKCLEAKKQDKKDLEYSREKKYSNDGEIEDFTDLKTLNVKSEYGVYTKIPNKLGRPSKQDRFLKMVDEMVQENKNEIELSENTNFER